MRVVIWTTEASWARCVDAARALVPEAADVTLLAVPSGALAELHGAGRSGLLGRRYAPPDDPDWDEVAVDAAQRLLSDARARLGRDARTQVRRGRVEREVVAACAGADLLICARDGDDERLGPKSLGKAARFVVDHAPCQVLLLWPGVPPDAGAPEPAPPPPHERRPRH
jgi:nucleotide-binding universal stress UspA family protein